MLKNKVAFLSCVFFIGNLSLFAQSHISTQSHAGKVTNVAYLEDSDGSVFSAGTDGFLVKWTEDGMGEHYQISDLTIKMFARSPNGNDIAVYESDGASLNRVSVWNWKTFTRKYAFRFNDSLTSIKLCLYSLFTVSSALAALLFSTRICNFERRIFYSIRKSNYSLFY